MTALQRQPSGIVAWLRAHRLLGFLPRDETICPPPRPSAQLTAVARDLDQLDAQTAALLAAQRRLARRMHEERHESD